MNYSNSVNYPGHAIVVTCPPTVKMLVEDFSGCFQQFYCLPEGKDLCLHESVVFGNRMLEPTEILCVNPLTFIVIATSASREHVSVVCDQW